MGAERPATQPQSGAVCKARRTGAGASRAPSRITIARGKILEIDLVADPERLRQLDLVVLDD